jgi:NAD(P)-dependent dehydrogenase (short-subunit alcohol dehydrogenase family)
MPALQDRVAIVTGASRGAGRGIAVELGAAGATVYVTGRSTRHAPAPGYEGFLERTGLPAMPNSIDETADEVAAAGGSGIPVRCDHTDPAQVRELISRVEREQGRLDVLVNNAWGGHETFSLQSLDAPFWEQPLEHWESMFDHGVRNHVIACHAAARRRARARIRLHRPRRPRDPAVRGVVVRARHRARKSRTSFQERSWPALRSTA